METIAAIQLLPYVRKNLGRNDVFIPTNALGETFRLTDKYSQIINDTNHPYIFHLYAVP